MRFMRCGRPRAIRRSRHPPNDTHQENRDGTDSRGYSRWRDRVETLLHNSSVSFPIRRPAEFCVREPSYFRCVVISILREIISVFTYHRARLARVKLNGIRKHSELRWGYVEQVWGNALCAALLCKFSGFFFSHFKPPFLFTWLVRCHPSHTLQWYVLSGGAPFMVR